MSETHGEAVAPRSAICSSGSTHDIMRAVWGLPPAPPVTHEPWRALVTYGDLERCPYGPFESGREAWLARDDERMKALVLARHPELRAPK